jgi:hypothetical protein
MEDAMTHRPVLIMAICLAWALGAWPADAQAGFWDLFRPDLKFTLVVDRTAGFKVDDPVYVHEQDGRREVIGRIEAIPDAAGGRPVLAIRIQARHKDRVRAGSRVVVDRSGTDDGTPRTTPPPPGTPPASPPRGAGAVGEAHSAAADTAARAAERVQTWMGGLLERSRDYFDRLWSKIDQDDLDQFTRHLRETADAVARYTREQKTRFSREVLPELERMMESARQRFRKMRDPDKEKDLEREFRRIQEELAI